MFFAGRMSGLKLGRAALVISIAPAVSKPVARRPKVKC
jgi:hypothetical protein